MDILKSTGVNSAHWRQGSYFYPYHIYCFLWNLLVTMCTEKAFHTFLHSTMRDNKHKCLLKITEVVYGNSKLLHNWLKKNPWSSYDSNLPPITVLYFWWHNGLTTTRNIHKELDCKAINSITVGAVLLKSIYTHIII